MLALLRFFTRLTELAVSLPLKLFRFVIGSIAFNPKLGPIRYVVQAALVYVIFAVVLVYAVAPLRGLTGTYYKSTQLRYDAERWLATAIYDKTGSFVGTFDPRLDSVRDVNYTTQPIELAGYVAQPDHKSIPVRQVPEHYWKCVVHLEDGNLGSWLNPFGIDIVGVLKIPVSTIMRSIQRRRPSMGVGGSTLPMQLARVIYKTPPSVRESVLDKIRRKFQEWWLAPVIYWELTRSPDMKALKHWVANHLWLGQRTGGQSLHGVEVTSQIVFGKEAKDLSAAEQFVLAGAVNRPIILLEGDKRLNSVRLDRWRYIIEVRARICVERLITNPKRQKQALFELVKMAGGPPEPKVRPKLQRALERSRPVQAERAEVNPVIRANTLMPSARLGIREEMKQAFGYRWRNAVRGVTTTLDVAENIAFHDRIETALGKLQKKWSVKIKPGFTLDKTKVADDRPRPDIIVAAADAKGRIVRYFESTQTAPYFGSTIARDRASGTYVVAREARQIASVGKIIAAIAIANYGRDSIHSPYVDVLLPRQGIESCLRRRTPLERPAAGGRYRRAIVAFACSMNRPIEWRLAQIGQRRVGRLINNLGFTPPPANQQGEPTPATTAAVRGLIAAAPQRVHHMSAIVLAALTGKGHRLVKPPTLIKAFDFTNARSAKHFQAQKRLHLRPGSLIRARGHRLIQALLSAPLCQVAYRKTVGTLKTLAHWCHRRRRDVRLHFAKTGTSVTADPDETVDAWITGGIQFETGAAYSYVVVVGTGSGRRPWARALHAGQVAAPIAETLLKDLAALAKRRAPRTSASTLFKARHSRASRARTAPADTSKGHWRHTLFGDD